MAIGSFLVVLQESASPQTINRIVSIVRSIGGNVGIITGQGKAIIATFDSSFAGRIRRLPYVKLVGGVRIGKRRLVQKQSGKQ